MNIQWFPGHMAKTRRLIAENLKYCDVVCEIVDARIPMTSRNPEIDALVMDKPRLILLNRVDQADAEMTKRWAAYFKKHGHNVLETDCRSGFGVDKFAQAVRKTAAEKLKAYRDKGQVGRGIRAMVVGIPNVGKSSLINRVLKRKAAAAADKPGVTRSKQWFSLGNGLELLDTPGILWPKLDDEKTGLYLAFTGAIKDEILDTETLACKLFETLSKKAPQALISRYKIEIPELCDGFELIRRAAEKRGFLASGGELDIERMARISLDEFRGGYLGRITLESPEEYE